MSYGHIKEASRLPGLPRRQVPAPGVCPPWPLTPSALGEPGQAGALQKEESEGAILVGWRGWDLGSNPTSFHVFAAIPWAGDPASPRSSRTPLLLVAVGRSAQFPVPCRMFKVASGLLPAPACSPLALTFLHRRRLRLLDPSLSLFEARAPPAPAAPAAPAGPAPQADSINSPGSLCRDQFQPPGPAPRANPGYTPPPGPHATQSWPCSSSGPAP